MDQDCKVGALKAIQGRIWEQGFARGELLGEIFPDVFSCLSEWYRAGHRIAIYSSGSVVAQKLVLGYTSSGSLVRFIEAFFDTSVGPKKAPSSYERIAANLALKAADILFVSDVGEELNAASAAGMDVVLSVRPGNAHVLAGCRYRIVHSLAEL
jgi:enolase-phosphatase E1